MGNLITVVLPVKKSFFDIRHEGDKIAFRQGKEDFLLGLEVIVNGRARQLRPFGDCLEVDVLVVKDTEKAFACRHDIVATHLDVFGTGGSFHRKNLSIGLGTSQRRRFFRLSIDRTFPSV